MSLTQEQLEFRRSGITATDMTKIAGVSPYGGPQDVLDDKRGLEAPFIETERVKWGNILEGPVRADYEQRHGVRVLVPGTVRHHSDEWCIATPDGVVYPGPMTAAAGPTHGWECKTHTIWLQDEYGDPGTDEVPAWELIQCAWNMRATDLPSWDLTAFIDGVPRDYHLLRDAELEETLVDMGRSFWFEHVVGGEDLEPDGSESYTRGLKRRFPKHTSDAFVTAGPEQLELVCQLEEIRRLIREQEKGEEQVVQGLKQAIGDAAGLEFPSIIQPAPDKLSRITWKRTKDSRRTDWKAAFQELRNGVEAVETVGHTQGVGDDDREAFEQLFRRLDDIVASYTTDKPGSRRFVVPRAWSRK